MDNSLIASDTESPVIETESSFIATESQVIATESSFIARELPVIATELPVIETESLVATSKTKNTFFSKFLCFIANEIEEEKSNYLPKVQKLIDEYKNVKIKSITIRKHPIPNYINYLINIISLGRFKKNQEKTGLNILYHLRLELGLENDRGTLMIEKAEVINMKLNSSIPSNSQSRNIAFVPDGLTLGYILEKTKKFMGDNYFSYSARDNNCQDFALAVLNSTRLGNNDDFYFIKQDVKPLFEGMSIANKLTNDATEAAAIINEIISEIDPNSPII